MVNNRSLVSIGETFGRWTVIGEPFMDHGHQRAPCRCSCGTTRIQRVSKLRSGESMSCGCLTVERMRNRECEGYKEILPGDRFGMLTVVQEKTTHNTRRGCYYHLCLCDCGTFLEVEGASLRNKRSTRTPRTCGCGQIAVAKSMAKYTYPCAEYQSEYNCWYHMIKRCTDESDPAYHHYGGRGISVHPAWIGNFNAFMEDVGPKPSRELSLDRIDVDGNYEPGNVRWATAIEQANNKRNNIVVKNGSESHTIMEWCRLLHLKPRRIKYHISRGLTPWEAIFLGYPRTRKRREQLGWNKPKGKQDSSTAAQAAPGGLSCAESAQFLALSK